MSFDFYIAYVYSLIKDYVLVLFDEFAGRSFVVQLSTTMVTLSVIASLVMAIKLFHTFTSRKADLKISRYINQKYYRKIYDLMSMPEKASYDYVAHTLNVQGRVMADFGKQYWLTLLLRDILFEIEDDDHNPVNMENLHTVIDVFELDEFFYRALRDGNLEQKMRITRTLRYFDVHIKNDEALAQMINSRYSFVRKNAIFTRAWNDPNDALTYFNSKDFDETFCRFDIMIFHDIMQRSITNEEDMSDLISKLQTQKTDSLRSLYIREIRFLKLTQCCDALTPLFEESVDPETSYQIVKTWGELSYKESEPTMMKGFPFQSNRVKVAILNAIANFLTGDASGFLVRAYKSAYDYDIKVESIRSLFAYHQHHMLNVDFKSISREEDRDLFNYFEKIS